MRVWLQDDLREVGFGFSFAGGMIRGRYAPEQVGVGVRVSEPEPLSLLQMHPHPNLFRI